MELAFLFIIVAAFMFVLGRETVRTVVLNPPFMEQQIVYRNADVITLREEAIIGEPTDLRFQFPIEQQATKARQQLLHNMMLSLQNHKVLKFKERGWMDESRFNMYLHPSQKHISLTLKVVIE